jgi:small-conductance mechanosensitive channel
MALFDIRTNIEDIERFRRQQDARIFRREFSNLWQPPSPHRPMSEIIPMSIAKEKLALKYYLRDYSGRLIILLVLIIAAWRFLVASKNKWTDEKGLDPGFKGQLVFRYPALSAVLVVISIFQFLFLQPPFIFSFILWLISAVSLCIIFYRFIRPYWMLFWGIMVTFLVLAGLTNMILEASRPERWWMLVLASAGAVYCISVLRSSKHQELREKNIRYFIVFVVLSETASIVFNVTGRYNLAKTLMVAGYSGLVIAVQFIWTVRLINEALVLIASVYKHPERKLFYINFERVGEKAPTFLYVFLVIGWLILVGKNFYAFQQATNPLMGFLGTERTIGNYDFTINSLVLFVVIIGVSTLISQVISFFAAEPGDQRNPDKTTRQPRVGSWLLLIRIFVLSLGLFLAFAAAGIPMDKLAIMLGALGVGIGLGLQGLVSNLVSGLIIAFEKPVNVGDIVEVNGKMGTMKSIGFRSSIINLTEGASFIIPNSDLLTNHLINWTMGKNRRRINVGISVNYGTDLKKVHTVLESILKAHDYVLHYPDPSITVIEFAAGHISISIDFWVADIRKSWIQRSEIMTRIIEAFDREGIEIPLPQQEITIKK